MGWLAPRRLSKTALLLALFAVSCGRGDAPIAPEPAQRLAPRSYEVGVDYHSYGADFQHTSFIKTYHDPEVRATVQAQLQGMADRGASVMSTRLWLVTEPGTTDFGESWRLTFPLSDQEAANLRAYAEDVAAVRGAGGNRLWLEICLLWLGAADYEQGAPATGIGSTPISGSEYIRRVEITTDKVLAALRGVTRPDGRLVTRIVYLNAPMISPYTPNTEWFMEQLYPRFVAKAREAGLTPSVYLPATDSAEGFLQDDFVDPEYPILNGHRSMYWAFRTLKWMVDRGMPAPPRTDFGFYISDPAGAPYARIFQRTLDDADAVMPSLGAPRLYGVAETSYYADAAQRRAFGQGFAAQSANPRFRMVAFWTTPGDDAGGPGAVYPFTIEDYLPAVPAALR